MTNDKVLLLELKERTSASGNRYLSGWLGKASVVAFLDKDAAEPTWQVFVSTPKPRQNDGAQPSRRRDNSGGAQRSGWQHDVAPRSAPSGRSRALLSPGELDDSVSDIGR